jgi:hypothetical protein
MIKYSGMRWAGNVAGIVQKRTLYILVGRFERKETAWKV